MVVVGTVAIIAAAGTSDAGAILAFVAALLVALITAYTAQRRQREALDAERARLDARFDHERVLTDCADLRGALERALSAYDQLSFRAHELRDAPRGPTDGVERALWEINDSINQMQLRLPRGNAVVEAYQRLLQAVCADVERVLASGKVQPSVALRELLGSSEDADMSDPEDVAYIDFVVAARQSVRSHVKDEHLR